MALGSANNSAQARGKNKAVKIKRRREIRNAASYTAFNCGAKASDSSSACAVGSLTNTFYHNGSFSQPRAGDIVYTSKRARNPNIFEAGFYKYLSRGANRYLDIDSSGFVRNTGNC
jgi:hypothetical protein